STRRPRSSVREEDALMTTHSVRYLYVAHDSRAITGPRPFNDQEREVMAARTGSEYIERLAASSPTVEIHGETVTSGIPDHPAFANVVRTYAHLYDLQHDPEHRDVLTYESPTTGDRVGTSFMVPRTAEDLVKRREMMSTWARVSHGFLGRTGDYLNACVMALSEAGPLFAQADSAYGENIARYYEKVREEDLLLTHTLIPPQVNRSL